MATHVASIVTALGLSVLIDNESHAVPKDHINYDRIIEALRDHRYEELSELLVPARQVERVVNEFAIDDPNFSYEHGVVRYKGKPLPGELSEKIVRMVQEGAPLDALLKFVTKLWRNPSATARREALLFFVANDMMIHEDGDFIAYKTVANNYYDKYSHTILNSVGQVVAIDRADVDDRRDVTCSFGLHFAAFQYAAHAYYSPGDHIMVLKINPADVVSIPSDYRNQKGRCSRYEVIAELPAPECTRPEPLPQREVYDYESVGGEDPTMRRIKDVLRMYLGWHEDAAVDGSETLYNLGVSLLPGFVDRLSQEFEIERWVLTDHISLFTTLEGIADVLSDYVYAPEIEVGWSDEDEEDAFYDGEEEEDDTAYVFAFSEGDRVRVVKGEEAGFMGIISEVDTDDAGGTPYWVEREDNAASWYSEDELELIDDSIVEWKGHRFKDNVCLNCEGRRLALESLGWPCNPNWKVALK